MLVTVSAVIGLLAGPLAGSALATPPENVLAPEVTQEPGQSPKVGETVVCYAGTWTETGISFFYQWLVGGRIVAEGQGSERGDVYTITTADLGKYISCNVIASNGAGESEEEESENSLYVPGPHGTPPELVEKPKVEGGDAVGEKLKCTQGVWTGSPTPTYSYEWLREGAPIELQTTNEYTIVTADEGHSLSCKVTATNSEGKAEAPSSNSVHVAASKPVNEEAPKVLAGVTELEVGESVTCSPGRWSGNPTFTYQWLREEPTKKTSEPISSATASTYIVAKADQLHKLYCNVTASNAEGVSTEATSSNRLLVRGSGPVNTALPKIEFTGPLEVGRKLKCSEGEWSGVPAPHETEVAWVLEKAPMERESVAFGTSYTAEARVQGHPLFCEVTVENSAGRATAVSEPVVVPEENGGEAPKNKTPPEVRGTPQVGETLDCTEGTWSGTLPLTPSYQWLRGTSPISGATKSTYTVASVDRGYSLSCTVAESNGEGTAGPVHSSNSLHVLGTLPEDIGPPHVSGNPEVKETLSCSQGEWRGAPTPEEFVYQWLRSGSVVASGTGYVVTAEDRGHSLTCKVTATNIVGSTSRESSNSVYVPGVEPENKTAPEVRGTPSVGGTLKCMEGKWSGAPTPTLSYQWLIEGQEIPSATGSTYTVVSADQGHRLACTVTAENVEGALTVKSKNSVYVPGSSPEDLELPSIEGAAVVGGSLKCERGAWAGKPPPEFTYEWLRNGSLVLSSSDDTYTPEASDVGQTLSCNVVAANTEGSSEAPSSNSVQIAAAPIKTPHQLVEQPKTTTVDPPKSTPPVATVAEVRSALSIQLTRAQHAARIASLLKHGDYTFRFTAPAAGRLQLWWYDVPKGAHVSSVSKAKPIAVAYGTASYTGATTKTVKLTLTSAGRRLLLHAKHITLTAKGVFHLSATSAVTWLKAFVLTH